MHITLLADGINRTGICASSAVDTLVINCVSHGTTSSLDFVFLKNFGEFTARNEFCLGQIATISHGIILAF
jgi:hypothetical protein